MDGGSYIHIPREQQRHPARRRWLPAAARLVVFALLLLAQLAALALLARLDVHPWQDAPAAAVSP